MRLLLPLALVFVAGPLWAGEAPALTVSTEVLVKTADPSPDGNGVFGDSIGEPVLNDAGQAAFWAELLATQNPGDIDDLGLYRASSGTVTSLVRGGVPSAAGNQLRLTLLQASSLIRRAFLGIDSGGAVSFLADDDQDMDAIYRADGAMLATVVQEGEDLPFGNNLQLGPAAMGFLVNDAGDLAYLALANPLNLLIHSDAAGAHQAVFSTGQNLPGGGTLTVLRAYAQNNSATVLARLNTASDTFGYFTGDGAAETILMQTGEPAPDGLGSFNIAARVPPALNDAGGAALILGVDDVLTDYIALYTGDATALNERIRTGATLPGGTLQGFLGGAALNDAGDVAFTAQVDGLVRLYQLRQGAFRTVAEPGEVLTEPADAVINDIGGWSQNEMGQVAFVATLVQVGLPQVRAAFLDDPDFGRIIVAYGGQAFNGGIITNVSLALPQFPFEANTRGNAQTALNNAGQVAFAYALDSGEQGVALATVERVLPDLIFRDSFETMN